MDYGFLAGYKIPRKPISTQSQLSPQGPGGPVFTLPASQGGAGEDTTLMSRYCCIAGVTWFYFYCFRPVVGMARKKKKLKVETSDDSSEESDGDGSSGSDENTEDSDESDDSSSDSSGDEDEKELPRMDKHGPPSDSAQLKRFYDGTIRPDHREVTCIIQPETVKFYFKRM